MSYNEELNDIWDEALKKSMCKCKTDDHWAQLMAGQIFCSKCETQVTEQRTETIKRESMRIRGNINFK
ncbi:hypothetical protein [Paenibacillus sp. QZ-Y1]|uniref:hypothetical protein n=1 Tax=Paenibacillus sp. QZ-Y1 TaxID=3414511 RepID=UPI003F7AFF5D